MGDYVPGWQSSKACCATMMENTGRTFPIRLGADTRRFFYNGRQHPANTLAIHKTSAWTQSVQSVSPLRNCA